MSTVLFPSQNKADLLARIDELRRKVEADELEHVAFCGVLATSRSVIHLGWGSTKANSSGSPLIGAVESLKLQIFRTLTVERVPG